VRPGRHAAGDGSFTRSAGAVGIRGAGLLLVAVILGVVLLNAADDGPGPAVIAASGNKATSTTTTRAPVSTTTTVAVRPAEQVKVLAANGTVTRGLGTRATEKLKALSYNALAPTDATKKPATTSTVYWAVGYQPEARAIAQQLGLPETAVQPLGNPPPVVNVGVANIIVVVGDDLAKTLPVTTSTTVKAGTATTVKPKTTTTTAKPKTTSTTAAAKTTTTGA
jgi:hypothetical protein